MTLRYFAYGSNLKRSRMRERAPSAHSQGPALLAGYRLVWDKRGADGTGKANLRADAAGRVWGVVYRLDAGDLASLDACEPGYERLQVRVSWRDGPLRAHTYLSLVTMADPVPSAGYKRLVLEGAREHGLPAEWIRVLEAAPER